MDEGFDEGGLGVGGPEGDGAVLVAEVEDCVVGVLGESCWTA